MMNVFIMCHKPTIILKTMEKTKGMVLVSIQIPDEFIQKYLLNALYIRCSQALQRLYSSRKIKNYQVWCAEREMHVRVEMCMRGAGRESGDHVWGKSVWQGSCWVTPEKEGKNILESKHSYLLELPRHNSLSAIFWGPFLVHLSPLCPAQPLALKPLIRHHLQSLKAICPSCFCSPCKHLRILLHSEHTEDDPALYVINNYSPT